ncbi:MAG: ABC-F family ATP-binding cassette domain-containing protein [Candidatus Shapirobacteria bacterium]
MAKERNPMAKTAENGESDSRKFVASIKDVVFSTYDRVLFYDVNFILHRGDTVAVTGQSGSGKTVLLKILMGSEQPDTGEVNIAKNTRISYVPQEMEDLEVSEDISVKELFFKARGLDQIEVRLRHIEAQMCRSDLNRNEMDKVLGEYDRIQDEFQRRGGYLAETEMDLILEGLGVDERTSGHINHETKLSEVSSGQRTRLLLGQALFADSNLLVLDNPTAHLDVKAVGWLASFVRDSNKAILIATQDTAFAEAGCNRIVEITDFGRVLTFEGNYSEFALKRDVILEAERRAAETAKEKLAKLQETYNKFKGEGVFRRSADMAQVGRALESRINRMQEDLENMPGIIPTFRDNRAKEMVFTSRGKGGTISFEGLAKSYDGYEAIDIGELDLIVKRGQILHISGENGSGKSTLVRMIADKAGLVSFKPDRGEIKIGEDMVVGYYAPDRLGISRKGLLFSEILDAMLIRNEGEASVILQFFGFPPQGLRERRIETLSGGEKKQLALAKIMAIRPNILLLDEPTDGLKQTIKKRVASALKEFEGAAVIVSHDSEFINDLNPDLELSLPDNKVKVKKN